MNVSVSVDFFIEEIAIAENSLSKKAEFMTKYCNIKQNSSVAWLDYVTVDKASKSNCTLDDFRNTYCVGGIDLSQTTDLTACCVVIEKDDKLHAFCHFFMPQNKIEELQQREGVPYETFVKQGLITPSGENFVNYKDCFDWFVRLVEENNIYPLKVGYDRYSAQYLIDSCFCYNACRMNALETKQLRSFILTWEGKL